MKKDKTDHIEHVKKTHVRQILPKRLYLLLENLIVIMLYLIVSGVVWKSGNNWNILQLAIMMQGAISLSAFLLRGLYLAPAIASGTMLNMVATMGHSVFYSIFFSMFYICIVYLSSFLLKKNLSSTPPFYSLRNTFTFMIYGVMLFSSLSATSAVIFPLIETPGNYFFLSYSWLKWFIEWGLGILIFTPAVIGWFINKRRLNIRESIPFFLITIVIVFYILAVFFIIPFSVSDLTGLLFILIVPMAWLAVRYSLRETMSLFSLIVILADAGAIMGKNNVIAETNSLVQMVLIVSGFGLTLLILGAASEERRYSEKRVSESEERFRRLADNAPDVIYRMILPEGEYEYISPSSSVILGYTPEEIYRTPMLVAGCIHPDWQEYFATQWGKLLRGEVPPFYEYLIITPSGEKRWLHQRNMLIRDSDGKPVALEGIVTDITGTKIAQELFNKAFWENPCSMSITSLKSGQYVEVNRTWLETLEYGRDEVVGHTAIELNIYNDIADRTRMVQRIMTEGSVHNMEIVFLTKNGNKMTGLFSAELVDIASEKMMLSIVLNITEQRRAEETVRKKDETLRGIAENFPGVVYKFYSRSDGEMGLYYVSERSQEFFDVAVEPLNTFFERFLERIDPSDRNGFMESITQAVAAKKKWDYEGKMIKPGGERIWFRGMSQPVETDGELVFNGLLQDVTGRKKAEIELKQREKILEMQAKTVINLMNDRTIIEEDYMNAVHRITESCAAIVNTSAVSVWIYEENYNLIRCIDHYEESTGHTGGETVNIENLRLYIDDHRKGKVISAVDVFTDSRSSEIPESYYKTHDIRSIIDAPVWLQGGIGGVLSFEHSGEQRQWTVEEERLASNMATLVSFSFEVAERKKAEREVQKLKNYLANIIDSNPAVMVGIDPDMRVTLINRQAEKVTGIDAAEAIGLPLNQVLEDFTPWIHDMREEMEKHHPAIMPGLSLESNGERHVYDLMLYPLVSNGIEGAVIHIDDVTEAVRKEEQLRQAQKMETVGTLAGGLAHDFNNVLSGIVGTVSLIRHLLDKDSNANERFKAFVDIIERSSKRAAEMVKQLLTLSRRYDVTRAPIDLNQAVKNVMDICVNTFDKSIDLHMDFSPGRAVIKGDPVQIEQVILNLCVNAAHAMTIMRTLSERQGGSLAVAIKEIKADQHFCGAHRDAHPGIYRMISVSDTGVGMDRETLQKIFDPFFTTKDKEHGTGLGLAMVYSIVHQHDGFIDVYSEPGIGSTFNIYLPEPENIDDAEKSRSVETVTHGSGLILIVDDEEIVRMMAEGILVECGYRVVQAENGREGIRIFRDRVNDITAVLLDMAMPGMSGREVYLEMKNIRPDVKVLLASGFRQDNRVEDALKLGINGFIQKPYSMVELSRKLREIIDAG